MKTLLKLILSIGLIFSFANCKQEDKSEIKGDFQVTDETSLIINNEEVDHSDFPDASISVQPLENNTIIAKLKNLVLGHPEVEILCTSIAVKSAPLQVSFCGTANYADIMNINIAGTIDQKNRLAALEIKTEYDYDIVGVWNLDQIILNFSHPKISVDKLNKLETVINKIIKEEKLFDDKSIVLTQDGYIRKNQSNKDVMFQYYIDGKTNLFYLYIRHTCTRELIDVINNPDSSLKDILSGLNLYDTVNNAFNVTIPLKYELTGKGNDRSLKLYMDEETIATYYNLIKSSIEKGIETIGKSDCASFVKYFPSMQRYGITPKQYDELKNCVINILKLLTDPDTKYKFGVKFDIAS